MTQHPAPVVRTASGRMRGVRRGGSAAFLGIPFAQAPVGDLRFAAPVPPEAWDGVRDAVAYGPTAKRARPGEKTLIPEPAVPGDATLNVNVFTPAAAEPAAALPVLVYIHGGGYTEGSPASPWYDGAAFARDGVVTVTVSYRLGFDGFGHIPGAVQNRGVRDWLAALKWVQENIAAFGGDPGRVTIAGQSAGGGAVLTLLGMPAARGLFSGAWALSPAPADVPAERARALSARLATLAGVPQTREGFAGVTETELLALQERAACASSRNPLERLRRQVTEGLAWGPMIDGELIAEPAAEALRRGAGAVVPLVLGATDDEFTMATASLGAALRLLPASVALRTLQPDAQIRRAYLAANAAQRGKGTAAVLGRYVTDAVFRAGVLRVAEARDDAPTWVYRFTWPSPVIGWACHCLDVPFWFDCLDAGVGALAGERPPAALADALHGAAVAFVRDSDPGWPAWSADAGSPGATRLFGDRTEREVIADGYAEVRALV